MEQVILVDEQDMELGVMEKMEVHEKALLHRAFSIFIFNSKGELLLQQRAIDKYHSGGLWTNTCCSHPRPGEDALASATRRLREEMGFETPLEKVFDFIYKATFDNGLTEYEFDYVFTGYYDGNIEYDIKEVANYLYIPMHQLEILIQQQPDFFTKWLQVAFPKVMDWWKQNVAGKF